MLNPRPCKTILVVDDEPGVAKLVRAVLLQDGYHVLVAGGGEEALTLAQEHPNIDLLLTDVMMPHLSGTALGATMSAARPELLVIYMSGYMTELLAEVAWQPDANFIAKPFTSAALSGFVARVLAAKRTRVR